jgi:hypothetical protein
MTIYPRLKGGVSNQMFQIAATIGFARRYGADYRIPLPSSVTQGQGNPPSAYRDTLFRNLPIGDPPPDAVVVTERQFSFHDIQIPDAEHVVLDGYWQTMKYWEHCRGEVLRAFDTSWCKMRFPADERVCAIHVRGGDYLRHSAIHEVCGERYYDNAMAMVVGHGVTDYRVFTDDPKHASKIFQPGLLMPGIRTDAEDLVLMSRAHAIIGCNSSFSWWAAMLGSHAIRVFPDQWFGPKGAQDWRDVVPDGWVKVAANVEARDL